MIKAESRFKRSDGILQRVVGDEILVTTAESDDVFLLGDSASMQWSLLDRPHTLEEIVGRLARLYDISGEVIRADVASLLEDLQRRGLVQEIPDDN